MNYNKNILNSFSQHLTKVTIYNSSSSPYIRVTHHKFKFSWTIQLIPNTQNLKNKKQIYTYKKIYYTPSLLKFVQVEPFKFLHLGIFLCGQLVLCIVKMDVFGARGLHWPIFLSLHTVGIHGLLYALYFRASIGLRRGLRIVIILLSIAVSIGALRFAVGVSSLYRALAIFVALVVVEVLNHSRLVVAFGEGEGSTLNRLLTAFNYAAEFPSPVHVGVCTDWLEVVDCIVILFGVVIQILRWLISSVRFSLLTKPPLLLVIRLIRPPLILVVCPLFLIIIVLRGNFEWLLRVLPLVGEPWTWASFLGVWLCRALLDGLNPRLN